MDWMLLPLRRYADFSGRSSRREFWMFGLLYGLVYALALALMWQGGLGRLVRAGVWPSADPHPVAVYAPSFWLGAGLASVWGLGTIIPLVAVSVRRLHDRALSGWWCLGFVVVGALPLIGSLVHLAFLVVMALEGTRGINRFGPDPVPRADALVF